MPMSVLATEARENVLGLIRSVGTDVGKEVLRPRAHCQKIQGIIAGYPIHPVAAVPGGMARPLAEEERTEIRGLASTLVLFAEKALELFETLVLAVPEHEALIRSETFRHETHYAGLVDDSGAVNFYDGRVRVVDPRGRGGRRVRGR
jgi:F420-non-reducing hydrogenase large subunit